MLVAAFHFDEDAQILWAQKLIELEDSEAAWKTANAVIEGATERYTPAWGEFRTTYSRWVERHVEERAESQLALDRETYSRQRFPSYDEGIQIAWKAYVDECGRQGKQPNQSFFDAWTGMGRAERRAKATGDRRRR